MESEKFMRFWFRITELYGLWPRKTNKCRNAIAYTWVYSFITIYAILKLSLIPSTTKVQDFVEIFVYLPSFLLFAVKFAKFLAANEKVGELLKTMKDLSNELGIKPGMEFRTFPLLFKLNAAQVALLPFAIATDTTKLAINRKMMVKLYMPESCKDDEMFYWIYFAYERSSVITVLLITTFDIITFAIIINLTRLAKAVGAKLREINLLRKENWTSNMNDVIRNIGKLKRFVAETCALDYSFILLFTEPVSCLRKYLASCCFSSKFWELC